MIKGTFTQDYQRADMLVSYDLFSLVDTKTHKYVQMNFKKMTKREIAKAILKALKEIQEDE